MVLSELKAKSSSGSRSEAEAKDSKEWELTTDLVMKTDFTKVIRKDAGDKVVTVLSGW